MRFNYLDGSGSGGGEWGSSGPSNYGPYNSGSMMPPHLSQSYPVGPNGPAVGVNSMHLPGGSHDPGVYSHSGIPSNGDPPMIASSLPPMSSFRSGPPGAQPGQPLQSGQHPPPPSSATNTTSPIYNNHSPGLVGPSPHHPHPVTQAGDTVGKALASVNYYLR